MFSSIRWLFGYSIFAVAGGFVAVRIIEAVLSPFLEARSSEQSARPSLSERLRRRL